MQAVIIDYGMGNLGSIRRAVSECGAKRVIVSNNPKEINAADKLILPGVGAFADGMKNLLETNLADVIRKQTLDEQVPLLGICLGMQLLATWGYEGGEIGGLNIIPGEVKKLQPKTSEERIPHIGWNEVNYTKKNIIFQNIENHSDFYFVHSYHFIPASQNEVIGTTPYCGSFVAALNRGSVWGVQFHPEKSSILGFNVLKNFFGYSG